MEKMKKLKAFRKRLLALVTSLLLFATMMPVNPTTVLAGEPLPPLALKKSFQKAEITWKSGRGSNAKFRIKLTVKKGTPEQVVPAEFYGAVGKTTNEAALRNNLNTFVTSEYPAVENADGSRT